MISKIEGRRNNRFRSRKSDGEAAPYSHIPGESSELGGFGAEKKTTTESSGLTFTTDEAISHIGFGKFHVILVLVLGLVWMIEGMEIFVLSVLSPYLRREWGLSYMEETLLPVLTSLGMMLSAPVWGWICDVYGRKKGLYISSIWFMYFAFLSTFSPNYRWLLILRFLVGVGIGSIPQVSTILAEYTPAKARGKILTFICVFWSVGFIFAACLSLWLMTDFGFRALLAALCIPGVLFLWSFWWMPESFRYYAVSGQHDKALQMLRHIAEVNGVELPPGTLKACATTVKKRGKLTDLLRCGYLRVTVTLWVIWFITIMIYYSSVYLTTEIFQRYKDNLCHATLPEQTLNCIGDVLKRKDYVDLIWASAGELPGVVVVLFFIDCLGRKRSLCVLVLFAAAVHILLFICLNRTGATIVLFAIRCSLVGFYPLISVYTSEAYPTSIRAVAAGFCYFFGRQGMLVAPFVAQALFHYSFQATKYFCIFSLVIGLLAVLALPFDTRNKQFE